MNKVGEETKEFNFYLNLIFNYNIYMYECNNSNNEKN